MMVRPSHIVSTRVTGLTKRFGLVLPRKVKRFGQDTSGVTAIEFGAIALPFFMILCGLIEFGLAFFVNRMLDYAMLETTRLIRTGQAMQSDMSAEEFKAELCSKMTTILCKTDRLTVDVQTATTFAAISNKASLVDDDGEIEETTSYDIGGASDIIIARAIYQWPMFTSILRTDEGDTGNMTRRLYSTVVFQNEPFPW